MKETQSNQQQSPYHTLTARKPVILSIIARSYRQKGGEGEEGGGRASSTAVATPTFITIFWN